MTTPSVRTTTLEFESHEPYVDPVIEAFKRDVDRTLIRELLKLTPEERLSNLQRVVEDVVELRGAMAATAARAGR